VFEPGTLMYNAFFGTFRLPLPDRSADVMLQSADDEHPAGFARK